MGRFETGHTKVGGRKKGTPNRLTAEIRNTLKAVMDEQISNIPDLLEQLEPKERLDMLIRLMPYTLPKITPVALNKGEPMNWMEDAMLH